MAWFDLLSCNFLKEQKKQGIKKEMGIGLYQQMELMILILVFWIKYDQPRSFNVDVIDEFFEINHIKWLALIF